MNSGAASFCTLCLWQPHQVSPATANFFINSFTTKHRKLAASKCGKRRVSPIRFHPRGSVFCSLEQNPCSGSSDGGGERVPEANGGSESVLKRFVRPIACVILCIAVSLLPIRRIQAPALAAPAAVELDEEQEEEEEEFGLDRDYTKRLLKAVSVVLRSIEEIRRGNGSVEELDAALEYVKAEKKEFEEEIVEILEEELQELKEEKLKLMKRSESLVKESKKLKWQYEVVTKKGEQEKERAEALVSKMEELDENYEKLWDSIGEVEDSISRKENTTFSVDIRELCFIERECEALVKSFKRELMLKDSSTSPSAGPITRLSKDEIQKDLENAQRKYLAQTLLPRVMDNEESGALLDEDLVQFAVRIKQRLQEAREVQRDTEASVRRDMKKFGGEKRFVVNTPTDEVVKGYPEIELKWMFGDKEVVVPKATNVHLYHGWKKWRKEVKADLKKNLLEDVDFGKQYMAQRQERVLLERDRVVAKTWYNEEKSRWEIDPVALPYAVSKKLVDRARIRHDWGIMYLTLKGDAVEYYVDIKAYDTLFEEFGGFDGLYMKMLAAGVQTSVQVMWIPFSELSIQNQFLVAVKFTRLCFIGLWNNGTISGYRDDIIERYRNLLEDIVVNVGIPVVDFLLPFEVRMKLGISWPEEVAQNAAPTPYLKWLYEANKSYYERNSSKFLFFQYAFLAIRTYVYAYILIHALRFLKKNIPRLPGVYLYLWMLFGPLRRSPNYRKLRRLKNYVKYKKRRYRRRKKAGRDPIRTAFDSMKRVKNPPIPLKDFSSIESMKDEINEVVAFLQNPAAFQEMGARAPRGVLIVGERGTGTTSLALAIAAEAKVPVVKIKAKQLEPGLWVGQSASNIRDLFQTARDLAPVIIFVEDFEHFAGVRGRFIHTKNQDHEALINQLLVELDGFEKQDGVILMATTKNLRQVDSALQRPGRMDRIFRLQKLSPTEREKILRAAAKETMDEEIVDFVDWRKVAEKTSLLRPRELKLVPVALEGSAFRSKFSDSDELMSYISWFATFGFLIPNWIRKRKFAKKLSRMLVNHLGLSLTKEDLQNVVDLMEPYGQISNGIELMNPPIDWTRESKFPHAVWAAGRGLIAHLLPNYDVVEHLWLEPTSWQGIGCTKISKSPTQGSENANTVSRSYLEKQLVFCFGSYVAAQLLLPLGEENLLSTRELRKAQGLAAKMVIQYGWGPDDSPAVYYSRKSRRTMSMGDAHEQEIAAKVEKMIDLAYSRARQMIQKNRRALEQIVEELVEFETLKGKNLQRIVEANGGSREKEPFSLVKVYNTQPTTSGFLEDGNGSSPILLGAPSN